MSTWSPPHPNWQMPHYFAVGSRDEFQNFKYSYSRGNYSIKCDSVKKTIGSDGNAVGGKMCGCLEYLGSTHLGHQAWLLWLQTSVRQTQRWLTEANFDTVHHRSFVKIVRMEDGKFNISPTQSTLQQHSRMRLSETAAGTGGRLASVLPLHSWSVDDFVHGRRCLHSRAGFSRESGGCRQQSRRWQRQQSMQCLRHWSAIRSRS